MKSAMELALDKIGNINVQKIEPPAKEKVDKFANLVGEPSFYKPSLYLDDRELSTIGNYKADDKVILVIECTVKSIHSSERMEGKQIKKTLDCSLDIEAIADITKG